MCWRLSWAGTVGVGETSVCVARYLQVAGAVPGVDVDAVDVVVLGVAVDAVVVVVLCLVVVGEVVEGVVALGVVVMGKSGAGEVECAGVTYEVLEVSVRCAGNWQLLVSRTDVEVSASVTEVHLGRPDAGATSGLSVGEGGDGGWGGAGVIYDYQS